MQDQNPKIFEKNTPQTPNPRPNRRLSTKTFFVRVHISKCKQKRSGASPMAFYEYAGVVIGGLAPLRCCVNKLKIELYGKSLGRGKYGV